MSTPRDDDREAIDRAFAELVAGYHLTADRPDPLPPLKVEPEPPASPSTGPAAGAPSTGAERWTSWADNHPLFVTPEPEPVEPDPEPEPDDRYVPEPQPPLPRPRLPILLAWSAIAYAAIVVLLAAFGVRLPSWMGWMAFIGFMGGFGVLVLNLPRSRPPGDDGAVL